MRCLEVGRCSQALDRLEMGGYLLGLIGGCNSVVECDLPKVEVEGSTPFTRSQDERTTMVPNTCRPRGALQ
jgi:hypothetical protein